MKAIVFSLLLGGIFSFSLNSYAEESVSCDCYSGPHPSKVDVRHLEYSGIGFDQGYSSLDLFLSNTNPWLGNSIFFLDLRGHIFNNGKPAANVGGGWRYLFES